jgi:hypothetical protein
VFVLCGCGTVAANQPHDASPDASSTRCDRDAPFGAPVEVASLNTGTSNEAAALSPDELKVWFSATRPEGSGSYDIYEASRQSIADPFSHILHVDRVNMSAAERWPHVTSGGLRMYATIGAASGPYDMMVAFRDHTDMPFSALQPIPGLSDLDRLVNDGSPYPIGSDITSQTGILYFHSNVSKKYEIYRSENSGSGFGAPTRVDIVGLAATDDPKNPVVTPDELTLYFSLHNDIWIATRTSVKESFRDPTLLSGLSASGLDGPSWISDDNCVLYLSLQDTSVSSLAYKIYVAARGTASSIR